MINHNKGKTKEAIFTEKYSPALGRAIAEKVEDGHTIGEICNKMKVPGFPDEKTVYRWKKKYPDFKALLNEAYQDLMFKMLDEQVTLAKELDDMTRTLTEVDSHTASAIKLHQTSIKARIQVIQFTLAKIAPKIVHDLKDAQADTAIPTVNIVMYADPKPQLE